MIVSILYRYHLSYRSLILKHLLFSNFYIVVRFIIYIVSKQREAKKN